MKIPAEIEALKPAPLESSIVNYPPFVVDAYYEAMRRYSEALEEWSRIPGCPF